MAIESKESQESQEIQVVRVSAEKLAEYLNRMGLNIDVGVTSFRNQVPERVNNQSDSGNAGTSTSATGGTGNSMHFDAEGTKNIVETLQDGFVIIGVDIPKIMGKAVKKGTREEGAEEGVEPQELS